MIKIAICDDECAIREYLSTLIRKQSIECEITEYASANDYLEAGESYDLLFLDIEMKQTDTDIDGMALARKIRSDCRKQPVIIFVTGFEEYIYDAFDVKAFQYLLKPINEVKFAEVLGRAKLEIEYAIKLQQEKTIQTICVQYAGTTKIVPIDTIYYMESCNHRIILHMTDGVVEYYARLSDLEQELSGYFYRIHKGYLVNLAYVDEYTKSKVTLLNGTKLMISKYKYTEFVKAYLKFMEKED